MRRDVVPLLGAGLGLALFELAWVFARAHALFLSGSERFAYLSVALTALPVLVLALGLVLRPGLQRESLGTRARVIIASCTILVAGRAAFLLTEGRRVRDLWLRPLLVVLLALAAAAVVYFVLERASQIRARAEPRERMVWSMGAALLVLVVSALDAFVLPRGYPPFHASLFAIALLASALAGLLWELEPPRWGVPGALGLSVLLLVCAQPALAHLAVQPNGSFVVAERAPFSAKLLRLQTTLSAPHKAREKPAKAPVEQAAQASTGVDLRDRDVLLITVDALRADVLKAYGGHGVTPELDRLAQESVVFRRAYTTAPHTSYALSSLLTAKFMKPVVELPGASADHATLPDIVRRYGYRTAAFYPPAIFFVDGHRFRGLRDRGFGFEYRKEMYAPAAVRVTQLEQYLKEAEPGHPLLAWVHLFEPHEPYDPPPELVREDSARARYEGEVMACDKAIAGLVSAFRAARPGGTVIVTADHGEEFGDHGGYYHGTTLYDEQVRVPLLWSSPGAVQPGVVDAPVELADVGTTLLSALGMPRDARMRGDDLGALLRDPGAPGPRAAFASVEDRHMVTDGKLKAICTSQDAHCQLFDLVSDPREQKNLAAVRPQDAQRLRGELDAFLSTIPRVEAMAMSAGVGFPEALARAKLGAPGAGPEVVPLLGDARAPVRKAAARALGELSVRSALPMLTRVRANDPDENVRAEAAIAALMLGEDGAAEAVVPLLASTQAGNQGVSLAGRAALSLARLERVEALPVLSALALDESAQEVDRLHAIAAIGQVGTKDALSPLITLLADVRLRGHVAEALAEVGGRKAASALVPVLAVERYQPNRTALAWALVKLKDARVVPLVERFLGMETGIPQGVRILLESKALDVASGRGARLSANKVRTGSWQCEAGLCVPGEGAGLVLPRHAGSGPVRVTFLLSGAESGAKLYVDDQLLTLRAPEEELSIVRDSPARATRFALRIEGKGALVAVAVAPVTPEIPAPAPEPWQPPDAGAPTGEKPSP